VNQASKQRFLVIYNPFSAIGGGLTAQSAFVDSLRIAFPDRIVFVKESVLRCIGDIIRYQGRLCFILQSTLSFGTLLILFMRYICRFNLPCAIHPRGSRIPCGLFDATVKRSTIKAIWWSMFDYLSKDCIYMCSSESEMRHYRARLSYSQQCIVVPDAYPPSGTILQSGTVYPNKLVYLGRASEEKNLGFVVVLFSRLKERFSELECLLVGPNMAGYLKKQGLAVLVRESGICVQEAISNSKQKESLLKGGITCLPSRWESFGLVCLESIEAGGYCCVTPNSFFNDLHNDFGMALDVEMGKWVSHIEAVLVAGFAVDPQERNRYISQFDPRIVGLEIRRALSNTSFQ